MLRVLVSRLRWPLLGGAAAALALATTTALAGSGVGATFNLGQTNTVDTQSVLTGNAGTGAELRVENTGGGPAVALVVNSGVAPLKVSSQTKVGGLNSDLLDGLDSTAFLRATGKAADANLLDGLDSTALPYWKLGGNAGTTAGTNFLGTTDDQPFELKAKGQRALRIEPTFLTPNLIGGSSNNAVTGGAVGAAIAGGGSPAIDQGNAVTDDFGTIGGGFANVAGDGAGTHLDRRGATVAGGIGNSATGEEATVGGGVTNAATARWGTVAGGNSNTAGDAAAVGGGFTNAATGNVAAVGGGDGNTADGFAAAVPGGESNLAHGLSSFAAGSRAKAQHDGSFVWADRSFADLSSTADNQFLVRATGGAKFLRGTSTFTNVTTALLAENDSGSGEGFRARLGSSSNVSTVITAVKQSSGTGNFFKCVSEDGATSARVCHINSAGTFVGGSDFAESLPAGGGRRGYEPGDVLSISVAHPGQVVKSRRARDRAVIGVYSTRPGVLGADKGGVTRVGRNDVPVAITGVVPVKATASNGAIRPGDLLTSSDSPGRAMYAGRHPDVGTVLGKSLGVLRRGQGTIRMLVMPR